MTARCNAELCPYWDGDGCPCARFDIDPPEPGTDPTTLPAGTYHLTVPTEHDVDAEAARHEDTCPKRRIRPHCQCYTPPEGREP
ncbi:hypothetical protein [Amycolatopsis sp. YIM 10]|uniref:hypothetical protein n=1 Tax=Amycolatopsis sp. YIM 10 TaxID=2653857 RepID=UPI00129082C6|nr:hypothetical protein [Amycolatopsis sp. YIM 10]QFU87858.1 hypothetical protein YIM_13360 [Amycolatopsis sp. YIM 10]QFU94829.1 hypothetical protein YIM_48520 [Amycolatopsis sp. YIM 10]